MLHPEVDLDHLGIRLHLIDTAFGQNAAFVQHRHPARESAAAAGDSYPTTRVLSADGVVSLIGCMMGNPFINAVYIGHPGWKAMGGRIGYSAATGISVIVLAWFGVIALMMALIPVVAILPILVYIGMLIGSQAFQETPRRHAPAIILALLPNIAAWTKNQIDGAARRRRSGRRQYR